MSVNENVYTGDDAFEFGRRVDFWELCGLEHADHLVPEAGQVLFDLLEVVWYKGKADWCLNQQQFQLNDYHCEFEGPQLL